MRGRERVVVTALLTLASAATGALAGFASGAAWALLFGSPLNAPALAVLTVGCLFLDGTGVQPLSALRQVPQLWGRIFDARTVAVLYGARLGIGPLTILRTWLWWGAFLAAASAGPGWAAAVGALFGTARVASMLVVGTRAGQFQPRERPVAVVVGALLLAATSAAAVLIDTRPPVPRLAPVAGDPLLRRSIGVDEPAVSPPPAPGVAAGADTTPVTPPPGSPGAAAPEGAAPELAVLLPDVLLPGWVRGADDRRRGLGPLDLAAAAAAEGDTPAERALLETRRFVRGHARGWRGPDDEVGYAAVYEFATGADAEAYLVDGVTTIEARGARVYDVVRPPRGRGFSQVEQATATSGSTVSHGVAFVRGRRFFLVFVRGRTSLVDPATAATAAETVASVVGG